MNLNTSSPLSFPCENSKSTDATNGNDFRQVVVTVGSQKSAKGEYIHKHYTYVCTFMTF